MLKVGDKVKFNNRRPAYRRETGVVVTKDVLGWMSVMMDDARYGIAKRVHHEQVDLVEVSE